MSDERGEIGSNEGKSYGGTILKGLFEDRLMANMRIRSSLEKVIEDQKNEEVVYKEYIHQVQEKPSLGFLGKHHETSSSKDGRFGSDQISLLQKRITELEGKYHQEFEKRVKLQKAFLNFKTEGNSIIDRLRFALRQVGSKYKKERLKNRHLTKRLNEQLLHSNEIGEEEKFRKLKQLLRVTNNELQKYKVQFNRVEDKFLSYKRMVMEHKKVILALRKKMERYEEENERLRKGGTEVDSPQRFRVKEVKTAVPSHLSPPPSGRPSELDISPMVKNEDDSEEEGEEGGEEEDDEDEEIVESDDEDGEEEEGSDESSYEEPDEEEIALKQRLKKYGVLKENSEEKDPKKLLKDQKNLIKTLLDRLETEEGERLKTEEQSSKIVQEEERTISFLESQIRSLTNNSLLHGGDDDDIIGTTEGMEDGLEGMSPMKDTI